MPPHNLQESPKLRANFLSQIFFWWLNDLFKKGYKQNLEISDLYATLPQDESQFLGDRFELEWNCHMRQSVPKEGILLRVLWKIFGWRFLAVGFIKFFEECISKIATPLCLGILIGYFMGDYDQKIGLLSGGGIVLGLICNIATMHPYFLGVEHIGMQIRLACSTALYRKVLKLKLASLTGSTTGQMINLMSNDVNRFDNIQHIHYLWIGVVQTGISTYILWDSFGPSCLCGLAVLIFFVPFQGILGSVFTKLRTKTAAITDKRIRAMNELLTGIRSIKMHCWETSFAAAVKSLRTKEILAFTKITALRSINWSLYYLSSKVTIFVTLIMFILGGNALTAEIVFVAVSLYNNIRITMTLHFPLGIAQLADFFVAAKRIQGFLFLDERPHLINKSRISFRSNEPKICVKNVTASWNPSDSDSNTTSTEASYVISNASLEVASNQLVAVIGPVGSGKSSFLQVLLKELLPKEGLLEVSGKVSYCSQEAWIFSGTVRDNILFGHEYIPEWYDSVVDACALKRDFDLLTPFKDETVIGDRGVNLSGGQKARISLARAVYANAEIYLLDDPLSAVDAEVARHIFEKCLKKLLRNKIVILVTHQIQFLSSVDKIILMEKGKFAVQGTFEQLMNNGIEFHRMILKNGSSSLLNEKSNREPDRMNDSIVNNDRTNSQKRKLSASSNYGMESVSSSSSPREQEEASAHMTDMSLEEDVTIGSVSFNVYRRYFGAGSNICSIFMLIVFNVLTQSLHTGSDYWLQIWCKYHEDRFGISGKHANTSIENLTFETFNNSSITVYNPDSSVNIQKSKTEFLSGMDFNLYNQITLYSSIIAFLFVFSIVRTATFFHICVLSSMNLHKKMLMGVIRAPIRFFDLNPTGRILNRFSKDTDLMDDAMPQTFFESMEIFLNVIGIIILVCIVSPYILIPTVVLAVAFYFIRRVYVRSARSVKRLEAIARSPVYSHITSTINGLTTIRAFQHEEDFQKTFCQLQDTHSSTWFLTIAMTRWIGMWLDWISVAFVSVVVMTLVFSASQVSGAQAGMAVSAAMFLTGVFQWGVRQSATVESQMVSIERILEYTKLQPEEPIKSDGVLKPPENWPFEGKIDIYGMSLKYGNNDPTLKNVNLHIIPKEKVGIVGRTGAGKSSLITALFRLAEPTGQIIIDGVNILNIGLHDLRSKISIIPQDPFLIHGTLRNNLNTSGKYSDSDIWVALSDVGLAETLRASPMGLDTEVYEGGSNYSVGERQLLCLARAILQRNKILILDEATANVDIETDHLVQKTIRDKFQACTVLTIAHRLFTVMDSDRILVMEEGCVKDFGVPHLLLQNPDGLLSLMVEQTGIETSRNLKQIAEDAYKRQNTEWTASHESFA